MTLRNNLLLLFSRCIIGGIFINAGWMKIASMSATIESFAALGIPVFFVYLVSFAELLTGILIVLGLWMRPAALVLVIIMAVATYLSIPGGIAMFALPLVMMGGLFALMASGSGSYAIRCNKKHQSVE